MLGTAGARLVRNQKLLVDRTFVDAFGFDCDNVEDIFVEPLFEEAIEFSKQNNLGDVVIAETSCTFSGEPDDIDIYTCYHVIYGKPIATEIERLNLINGLPGFPVLLIFIDAEWLYSFLEKGIYSFRIAGKFNNQPIIVKEVRLGNSTNTKKYKEAVKSYAVQIRHGLLQTRNRRSNGIIRR